MESTGGASSAAGAFEGFRLLSSKWSEAKDGPYMPESPSDALLPIRPSLSAHTTAQVAASNCDKSIYMPVPSAVSVPNLGGVEAPMHTNQTVYPESGAVLTVETIPANEPLPDHCSMPRSSSRRSIVYDRPQVTFADVDQVNLHILIIIFLFVFQQSSISFR